MLAACVTPPTGTEAVVYDLDRMREITARSSDQNDDAELTAILDTALDDIEQMSGLKIRGGTFEATFPVRQKPSDTENWSTGTQPIHLDRWEHLAVPGVGARLTSFRVASSGADALYRATYSDRIGNLFIIHPDNGWDFADPDTVLVASFTAGGEIPRVLQQAIGLRARWHLDQEPEDEEAARRQVSQYAYRQDW